MDWDSGEITTGRHLERQVALFLEMVDQSRLPANEIPGYLEATARIGSARSEDWGGPGLEEGVSGGSGRGSPGGSGQGSVAAHGSGGGLARGLQRGLARGLSKRGAVWFPGGSVGVG